MSNKIIYSILTNTYNSAADGRLLDDIADTIENVRKLKVPPFGINLRSLLLSRCCFCFFFLSDGGVTYVKLFVFFVNAIQYLVTFWICFLSMSHNCSPRQQNACKRKSNQVYYLKFLERYCLISRNPRDGEVNRLNKQS